MIHIDRSDELREIYAGENDDVLARIINAVTREQRGDPDRVGGLLRIAVTPAGLCGFLGDAEVKRLAQLLDALRVTVGLGQESLIGSPAGLFGPSRPVYGFSPGQVGDALVRKGFRM